MPCIWTLKADEEVLNQQMRSDVLSMDSRLLPSEVASEKNNSSPFPTYFPSCYDDVPCSEWALQV